MKSGIAAICLVFSVCASQAQVTNGPWTTNGNDSAIHAYDCDGCDNGPNIVLTCDGTNARIAVFALTNSLYREGEFAPLRVSVLDQYLSYQADIKLFGPEDYVPVFSAPYNDPLIAALQAGNSATFTYSGGSVSVGLSGSRKALASMKQNCGGQDLARNAAAQNFTLPNASSTVLAKNEPVPDANGLHWFTGDGQGGGSPKSLRFALPETDAIVMFASCEQEDVRGILLETYIAQGDLQNGDNAYLEIQGAEDTFQYEGQAFVDGEEYAGARFYIPKTHTLFSSIATSETIELSVNGNQRVEITGAAGAAPLSEFGQLCR